MTRFLGICIMDTLKNIGALLSFRYNPAKKGVRLISCEQFRALNLPVPVTAGTYPIYVSTGWALLFFALAMKTTKNIGDPIMEESTGAPAPDNYFPFGVVSYSLFNHNLRTTGTAFRANQVSYLYHPIRTIF